MEQSYTTLSKTLFNFEKIDNFPNPQLFLINKELLNELKLLDENNDEKDLLDLLMGKSDKHKYKSFAQAYAGHQFGHFTNLGDGRAIILGEAKNLLGDLFDIQLKGSGRTKYSRGGDGKATLGSMIREYVISESMFALRIPTNRSLAVIKTGEFINRQTGEQPGAVLCRVAKSHIRVGTFQYLAAQRDTKGLEELLKYSVNRHFPELYKSENLALSFLNKVMKLQINLVTEWLRVGFIHGVMNTDNVLISGETIDYGPCAFMDIYNPNTVFSSIDSGGRYAFGNQMEITYWNLCRLAEALLNLIHKDSKKAVELAQEVLNDFNDISQESYYEMMSNKIGIHANIKESKKLITELLGWMKTHEIDYTHFFYELTYYPERLKNNHKEDLEFIEFFNKWQDIQKMNPANYKALNVMQNNNPVIIPRNYLVEEAIHQVINHENTTPLNKLINALESPYENSASKNNFQNIKITMPSNYKTYCGT